MVRGNKSVVILSRDVALARSLEISLSAEGFLVTVVADFTAVPRAIDGVVVLDISFPGDFKLCRQLHEDQYVPIMVLTSGGDTDRLKAFHAGAEDCMTKPVNLAELAARVHKMMPRINLENDLRSCDGVIIIDDLSIDSTRYQVKLGQKEIKLTAKEFSLLLLLASRKGRVVSRNELIKRIWGGAHLESDRTVDVHVSRIRRKIEVDSRWPRRIVPVRGMGYKLQQ
jgi:DNA-binding response OmpR family regulator